MAVVEAMIRRVPKGGTRSIKALSRQLTYLSRQKDPNTPTIVLVGAQRHRLNPGLPDAIDPNDVRAFAHRLYTRSGRLTPGNFNAELGNDLTMHFVISFPDGTDLVAAERTGRDWAENVFGHGFRNDRGFVERHDYVTAFHNHGTQHDHPHMHVVVDRVPLGGGNLLTLSRGHVHWSYEAMRREAVDAAAIHGISLVTTPHAPTPMMRPLTRDEEQRRQDAASRVAYYDPYFDSEDKAPGADEQGENPSLETVGPTCDSVYVAGRDAGGGAAGDQDGDGWNGGGDRSDGSVANRGESPPDAGPSRTTNNPPSALTAGNLAQQDETRNALSAERARETRRWTNRAARERESEDDDDRRTRRRRLPGADSSEAGTPPSLPSTSGGDGPSNRERARPSPVELAREAMFAARAAEREHAQAQPSVLQPEALRAWHNEQLALVQEVQRRQTELNSLRRSQQNRRTRAGRIPQADDARLTQEQQRQRKRAERDLETGGGDDSGSREQVRPLPPSQDVQPSPRQLEIEHFDDADPGGRAVLDREADAARLAQEQQRQEEHAQREVENERDNDRRRRVPERASPTLSPLTPLPSTRGEAGPASQEHITPLEAAQRELQRAQAAARDHLGGRPRAGRREAGSQRVWRAEYEARREDVRRARTALNIVRHGAPNVTTRGALARQVEAARLAQENQGRADGAEREREDENRDNRPRGAPERASASSTRNEVDPVRREPRGKQNPGPSRRNNHRSD